eukprot:GILJ01016567.1.p1 GENE.GILJ01016567.1~~GILJ01016567.1.p1  ORF type:complete len:131 (-),score=13.54 GILJ01016567.1:159-551(-)
MVTGQIDGRSANKVFNLLGVKHEISPNQVLTFPALIKIADEGLTQGLDPDRELASKIAVFMTQGADSAITAEKLHRLLTKELRMEVTEDDADELCKYMDRSSGTGTRVSLHDLEIFIKRFRPVKVRPMYR